MHRARVRSFDELARRALSHPSWPGDVRPGARSLGALLGKLDRGLELEWLRDREGVQVVLADLLGEPLPDLRAGPAAAIEPRGYLTLRDLRFARPLDLRAEPLPPGIPATTLDTTCWPAFWRCGPGSGRGLVAHWVQTRGLATHRLVRDARDLTDLPAAAFLEVSDEETAREALLPLLERARTECRALLVAAPWTAPPGFRVLESPPPATILAELARWAAGRLPPDGRFAPAVAAQWLEAGPMASGAVTTWGGVLGWLGVLDELGPAPGTPVAAARRWLERRVAELARHDPTRASWLRRHLLETLLLLTRSLLMQGERWEDPREREDWLRRVPVEAELDPDLPWAEEVLGDAVDRAALRRAARRAPPGAWRLVEAMRAMGLLRREPGSERWVLGPRWLGELLVEEAARSLAREDPRAFGAALLGREAPRILRHLQPLVTREDRRLAAALGELDPNESASASIAHTTLVVVLGWVLLEGGDLDPEVLAETLGEHLAALVPRSTGEAVPPLLPAAAALPGEPTDAEGFWWLAVLAVADGARGTRAARRALDRLWPATDARPRLVHPAAARAARVLEQGAVKGARWAKGALALVDRLRLERGPLGDAEAPHAVELAHVALDELSLGLARPETLAKLSTDAGFLQLGALGEVRRVPRETLLEWLGRVWAEHGYPAFPWLRGEAFEAMVDAVWSPEVGARALGGAWPHPALDPRRRTRRELSEWVSRAPELLPPSATLDALLEHLPEELVPELTSRAPVEAVAPRVFGRSAALAARCLESTLQDTERAHAWITLAPTAAAGPLLECLAKHAPSLPAALSNAAVDLCLEALAARAPGLEGLHSALRTLVEATARET